MTKAAVASHAKHVSSQEILLCFYEKKHVRVLILSLQTFHTLYTRYVENKVN